MGCVTGEASERDINKLRDRREGRMEDSDGGWRITEDGEVIYLCDGIVRSIHHFWVDTNSDSG